MYQLSITPIPLLRDNYAYILHEPRSGITAVVDPSEAPPIHQYLQKHQLPLHYILNTHHHWDHTGGNVGLKREYGCKVVGFSGDAERIPHIDMLLEGGATFRLGAIEAHILHIPGHTLGHIAYYFPEAGAVFTGDTLFSLGCGRLFEGTPGQMWVSLSKLKALPPETLVYCGHEYTQANCEFALSLEPDNQSLQAFYRTVKDLRSKGGATIPSSLQVEAALNPFLRVDDPDFAKKLDLSSLDPISLFTEIRHRKDNF